MSHVSRFRIGPPSAADQLLTRASKLRVDVHRFAGQTEVHVELTADLSGALDDVDVLGGIDSDTIGRPTTDEAIALAESLLAKFTRGGKGGVA
jgi:hypothetical protein